MGATGIGAHRFARAEGHVGQRLDAPEAIRIQSVVEPYPLHAVHRVFRRPDRIVDVNQKGILVPATLLDMGDDPGTAAACGYVGSTKISICSSIIAT